MEKNQAMQIIQQALAQVKATVQEHQAIQEAYKTLVTPEKKEEKKDGKETKV